ncbi:hypothetical protein JST97_01995 [bacterium]|nr:hypothetical protein [bacterium]
MFRLLFLLLLSLTVFAEESPVVVRGQFHGKVRDQTFERDFDVRMEPGEKSDFQVEMENINLSLGIVPKWHYASGTTPDGIMLNFFVKCSASEPKMVLQRTATVLLQPGQKSAIELHERDSDNVFSVDFSADRENPNVPSEPKPEPKPEPGAK